MEMHVETIRLSTHVLCKSGPRDWLFRGLGNISETESDLKTTVRTKPL